MASSSAEQTLNKYCTNVITPGVFYDPIEYYQTFGEDYQPQPEAYHDALISPELKGDGGEAGCDDDIAYTGMNISSALGMRVGDVMTVGYNGVLVECYVTSVSLTGTTLNVEAAGHVTTPVNQVAVTVTVDEDTASLPEHDPMTNTNPNEWAAPKFTPLGPLDLAADLAAFDPEPWLPTPDEVTYTYTPYEPTEAIKQIMHGFNPCREMVGDPMPISASQDMSKKPQPKYGWR